MYVNALNVPTWNYAAVCVEGVVEWIEDADQIEEILQTSVKHFESLNKTFWRYELPESFRSRLLAAIVGFKIKIDSIEGKFKMNQNRDPEDFQSVLRHFESNDSSQAQSLAHWMKRSQHVL
jgi:transcriptional regulator